MQETSRTAPCFCLLKFQDRPLGFWIFPWAPTASTLEGHSSNSMASQSVYQRICKETSTLEKKTQASGRAQVQDKLIIHVGTFALLDFLSACLQMLLIHGSLISHGTLLHVPVRCPQVIPQTKAIHNNQNAVLEGKCSVLFSKVLLWIASQIKLNCMQCISLYFIHSKKQIGKAVMKSWQSVSGLLYSFLYFNLTCLLCIWFVSIIQAIFRGKKKRRKTVSCSLERTKSPLGNASSRSIFTNSVFFYGISWKKRLLREYKKVILIV